MKGFKVHNVEESKQEVNLPAGTYTYSCRVIPVGTSYTFRLDNQSFTFEGLTAGVLNKRMKHTFELTEAVSFFYLSNTVGDCVYEPQIEEGVFATTPGAHPLDFERLISEAGIEIDHEALSLYAKKADVSAEIQITADRIDSTVGSISNDVDGLKGDMTTISQTVNSISSTVYNEHGALLSQISQDGVNVRITASKIKLEGLVTVYDNFKVLEDGSIEAKNGKFTGQITSTSGTIGGFNIGSNCIGAGSNWNTGISGMSLWDDFIVFNKPSRQALIGATSSLGFDFLGRFSDTTSQPYSTKTGVIINISGGYKNNALDVTGDILLNGNMSLKGAIDGLSVRTRQISTTTYLTSEDVYVSCYNSTSITVYLPSSPVIGKVIFIRTINTATVTINGNGKTINWGTGTGASRGVGDGRGDTVMLVYDGQFWMYNYMIR